MQQKFGWLNSFCLEPRFLGLSRLFLGVILLIEYFLPVSEIPVWYSNLGIVSTELLKEQYPLLSQFNLFNYFESLWFLYAFFVLFFISTIFFTIGYHTRLATILVSFCLYQLYLRNPYINSGGDEILRTQILILIFLRPAEYFSIDAAFRRSGVNQGDRFSMYPIWHFVYVLQLLAIYFFSALMKSSPQWWKEFTALEYALSLDLFVSSLGRLLLNFPNLMSLFSGMTFYGEWLLPVIFILIKFLPFKKIRMLTTNGIVLFFMLLHISIILTMNIGHFPWICLSLWLPVFTSEVYDWIFSGQRSSDLQICYDGNCLFCRKGIYLLCHFLGIDPRKNVVTQYSDPELGKLMEEQHSWVVRMEGKDYFRYHAFLIILKNHSSHFIRLMYFPFFILKPLGDLSYKFISKNRELMGRLISSFKFYEPKMEKKRIGISLFGGVYFLLITYINFLQLNPHSIDKIIPNTYYSIFGLSQNWNMFAPNPRNRDEWILILNEDELGHSRNYASDKAQFFSSLDNKRWKKIYFSMFENPALQPWFIQFYCREHQLKGRYYAVYFYQQNYLNQQESRVVPKVKASSFCK